MFLRLSRFFIYASLLSIVLVSGYTFFPFIGVKYFFFRTMVELALGALLIWWAFENGNLEERLKRLKRNWFFWAVTAFALFFVLASIFAYDPNAAFWSNYERGEGGFQMLHYYAFFLILMLAFEREEEWRMLMYVTLGAAVLMILYGLGANIKVPTPNGTFTNPLGFIGPYMGAEGGYFSRLFNPGVRFQGSLGNPAYVAPYLMFAIFFAAWLWIKDRSRTLLRHVAFGALILFFLLFFMLSETRGTSIGLMAGIYVALAYLGFVMPKRRMQILVLLGAFLVVGGVLVHFVHANPDSAGFFPGARMLDFPLGDKAIAFLIAGGLAVAALVGYARERKYLWFVLIALLIAGGSLGARLGIFSNFSDPTANTRFWTWGSAIKGFEERPVLGWGPENFSVVFDKYFDTRHWVPGQNTETWFDRAHNTFLDYLTETGILGLLAYLSIFAVFFWQFFRPGTPAENRSEGGNALLGSLALGMIVTYLVQGFILFDVMPMYINLLLAVAFFAWRLKTHGSIS